MGNSTAIRSRGRSRSKQALSGRAKNAKGSTSIEPPLKRDKKSIFPLMDTLEILSWILANCFLGLWYNSIGTIASWRGIDYAVQIELNLDQILPVVKEMIIPYMSSIYLTIASISQTTPNAQPTI